MRRSVTWLVSTVVTCIAGPLAAQRPTIFDINTYEGGGIPRTQANIEWRLVEMGGWIYFRGETSAAGAEFHRCRVSSPHQTEVVKDINPGPKGSYPESFHVLGNTLLFFATDGKSGSELWRSDGTTAGTRLVRDINPGIGDSRAESYSEQYMVSIGNAIVFSAYDNANGYQMWASDGTTSGTVRLTTGDSLAVSRVVSMKNHAYFVLPNQYPPGQLWKTDGTAKGTANLGVPCDYWNLASIDKALVFSVSGALWASDGTKAGSGMIASASVVKAQYGFHRVGNVVLFAGYKQGVGTTLFRTNATAAGTYEVKNVTMPQAVLGVVRGKLIFGGMDAAGCEPWRSDGTANGTFRLRDILAGPADGLSQHTAVAAITATHLYFNAESSTSGIEIWRTDGTVAGTQLVRDINPGTPDSNPRSIIALVNGEVAFIANDAKKGPAIWLSGGTSATTRLVNTTVVSRGVANFSSNPGGLTDVDGQLLFAADDGKTGYEVWRSDGTQSGTRQVVDLNSGIKSGLPYAQSYPSAPQPVVSMGGEFYFHGTDGTNYGIWRTNGTAAGTKKLMTAYRYSTFQGATVGRGVLVFGVQTNSFRQVVAYDRNTDSIRVIDNQLDARNFARLGRTTYFFRELVRPNLISLWRSDGKTIFQVAKFSPEISAYTVSYARRGRTLFILATDRKGVASLMAVGETSRAPTILKQFPLSLRSERTLANAGGTLFFPVTNARNGVELWKSNGTVNGTVLVKEIVNTFGNYYLGEFVANGGDVYFTVNYYATVSELWRSDGTSVGTTRLRRFERVPYSRFGTVTISNLIPIGQRMAFQVSSTHDIGAVWITNRTGSDMRPLTASSGPMTVSNGRLFHRVRADVRGTELAATELIGIAHPFGAGCAASGYAPRFRISDPFLGKRLFLSVDEGPANANGILFVSLPIPQPIRIGFGCSIYADPGPASANFVIRTDANGSYRYSLLVPNDPTLYGSRSIAQVGIGPTAVPPLGIDLSNAVLMRAGR